LLIDDCRSGGEQDPFAEQVEVGPAEHGPLEHLDPVHVTLDGGWPRWRVGRMAGW
jgi:hypothetical protein